MHKLKSILLTLPAISLLVLGLSSGLAYARDGSDSGLQAENTSVSDNVKPGPKDSSQETEATQAEKTQTEDNNKTEAQKLLQTLRQEHKEHTEAERQKNCRAAENGLEHKLTNLGKNGGAFKTRIDNILTKAQTYQSTNNVQVTDWATLLAAAQAAQTKAAGSVAALQALNVNLDCTSSTVADNVATFRTAAQQARTDLIAYKQSVKSLLQALKTAAGVSDTSSNTTGGTQ